MSLYPDSWIKEKSLTEDLISPFIDHQVKDGNISYGLSSYGYDIRISEEFKIFTSTSKDKTVLDPKKLEESRFEEFIGDVIIPPNTFVLGKSVEYFKIPRETLGVCFGKSTYARIGVIVNITPLEPGWEGYLTIQISNTASSPVRIYSNEGIAQVLFLKASEPCLISYSDRKGAYNRQIGITLPKI